MVKNLGWDQILLIWIYNGHNINILKVKDEKNRLAKYKGHFEWCSPTNIMTYGSGFLMQWPADWQSWGYFAWMFSVGVGCLYLGSTTRQ